MKLYLTNTEAEMLCRMLESAARKRPPAKRRNTDATNDAESEQMNAIADVLRLGQLGEYVPGIIEED